ncbi:MAG: TonB-dependent receptor [Bdellovibrionales bacterium]|nr:TonB-dependent receptor [Bdellovibrionales bacterium]
MKNFLKPYLYIIPTLFVTNMAWAQGESSINTEDLAPKDSVKASDINKDVEKIKVTGSHIKRINIEGPSPIQVLNRDDLDRSGYNSVSDVLRDSASSSFGAPKEMSGSNAAGVASVSLRGLGESRTLVLLNGKRLPTDAITGAVDLNLIPMAAIERIEVFKDGASATYGSDALGGVVNLITRKDYSDTEVSLQQTINDQAGGQKFEVSVVNGMNTRKLNMVNVAQYRKNDEIFAKDRDFSDDGLSLTGSPGAYRQYIDADNQGPWIVDPNCPTGSVIDLGPAGQRCSYKFTDFSTSLPRLEQQSLMSETTYNMTDSLKLNLRMSGTQKKIFWQYAPSPGSYVVDAATADTLGLAGIPAGSDVQFNYRLQELGNRQSEVTTNAFNVIGGVTKELGDSWELEYSTSLNRVFREDLGVNGYGLEDKVETAIESGNFKPTNPEGQRGNISNAKYVPWQRSMSEILTNDVVASGEVFDMPSGAASLAIGYTNTHQEYVDNFDEESLKQNVIGSGGSAGGGKRDTNSLYSEFSVPLASSLEMQLAARYDNYSDFGETTNPKIAFLYRPKTWLMFRTSAGTGFKAPSMVDLYAAEGYGFPTVIDQRLCNEQKAAGGVTPACRPTQYLAQFGGNEKLEEEKSVSYNFGTMVQPTKNLSFGADLWFTKIDNIVDVDYDAIMDADAVGLNLAAKGITVNRNETTGEISSIIAPNQNLSGKELYGIDLTAQQSLYTGIGKFRVVVEHSHLFFYKYEGFQGLGFKNILGEKGKPAWRNNITLGYSPKENQEASLVARTIASHDKEIPEYGDLQQYTEYDLRYSYDTERFGMFTAGVKNLFKTTPPLDDSDTNNQLDIELYSQLGQSMYVNYKKSF